MQRLIFGNPLNLGNFRNFLEYFTDCSSPSFSVVFMFLLFSFSFSQLFFNKESAKPNFGCKEVVLAPLHYTSLCYREVSGTNKLLSIEKLTLRVILGSWTTYCLFDSNHSSQKNNNFCMLVFIISHIGTLYPAIFTLYPSR